METEKYSWTQLGAAERQLRDVDVRGIPAGHLGQDVAKGYSAQQDNWHGCQLSRVLASWYEQVVPVLVVDSGLHARADSILVTDQDRDPSNGGFAGG